MKVKISYFGHIREKAGYKSDAEEIEEGLPLGDLLEPLCKRRNVHHEVFGESDQIQESVNILVNGRNIRFLQGLDTPLRDGDSISIFPPTGGG